MSHRTNELPPASGLARIVRELRYHELSRQLLAVALLALFALTAAPPPLLVYVGLPIAAVGMLVRLHASGFVMKNKELATTGPYALMRHPLYTGNILLVTGFAIASGRWWAVPLSLAFFLFFYPPAIEYEDRKLHRLFGPAWQAWSRKTPALVPNLGNAAQLWSGGWSFAKSTKQNGEIVVVAYVAACMAWVVWRMNTT